MLFKYAVLFIFLFGTVLSAKEERRYWVYFADKPEISYESLSFDPESPITDRALTRRQLRGSGPLFDTTDLPLSQEYISVLENAGIEIYRKSRWLNAVSCYFKGVSIEYVKSLSFVVKMEPVRTNIHRPLQIADYESLEKPSLEDYEYR